MDDRDFIERIDACRPHSDDFRDDHLAPLADELTADPRRRDLHQRVQQLDAAIGAAMEDVPLPAGLQQRLLQRLSEAQAVVAPPPVEATVLDAALQPARPGLSRRAWLGTAVAVASAASLAGVALVGRGLWSQPELTAALLQDGAITYYLQEQRGPGHDLQQLTPKHPLSHSITGITRYTWRKVDGFLGRPNLSGIAFDLSNNAGAQATLYVLPTATAALPTAPPLRPGATTANCSFAAWNEGSLTYVLVVKGGERAYQSFVRSTTVA